MDNVAFYISILRPNSSSRYLHTYMDEERKDYLVSLGALMNHSVSAESLRGCEGLRAC